MRSLLGSLLTLALTGCADPLTTTCEVPHLRQLVIYGPVHCGAVQRSFWYARDILVAGGRVTPEQFNEALQDLIVDHRPGESQDEALAYYHRQHHLGYVRLRAHTKSLLHELLHHLDYRDHVFAEDGPTHSGHVGWDTNGYEWMISKFWTPQWD